MVALCTYITPCHPANHCTPFNVIVPTDLRLNGLVAAETQLFYIVRGLGNQQASVHFIPRFPGLACSLIPLIAAERAMCRNVS